MSRENPEYLANLETRILELEKRLKTHEPVEHICFTCKHFILRDSVPHIRVCRNPREDLVGRFDEERHCIGWMLQPDPDKRHRSFIRW